MGKLIQVDFYPDGRVIKINSDNVQHVEKVDNRHMTPKELLAKRLEKHKNKKTLD